MTDDSPGHDWSNVPCRLPDQDVNVARIQPVLGHQSSINKKLGIRGQRQSEDNTDAEVGVEVQLLLY